jgi:hypothetical protein
VTGRRAVVEALGIVFGPGTLSDPNARARAAVEFGEAGVATVAMCPASGLGLLLADATGAGSPVVLLDVSRAMPDGTLAAAVRAVLGAVRPGVAAVACAPVTDTLKVVGRDGVLHATADRDRHADLRGLLALGPDTLGAALPALPDPRTASPDSLLRAVVSTGGTVLPVEGQSVSRASARVRSAG